MSKPTEEIEWAEGASAEVEEPDALRPGGFPFGFVPAAQQINWMWRTVGRWVKWAENKIDTLDITTTELSKVTPKAWLKVNRASVGGGGQIAASHNIGGVNIIRDGSYEIIITGTPPSGLSKDVLPQLTIGPEYEGEGRFFGKIVDIQIVGPNTIIYVITENVDDAPQDAAFCGYTLLVFFGD